MYICTYTIVTPGVIILWDIFHSTDDPKIVLHFFLYLYQLNLILKYIQIIETITDIYLKN